MLDIGGVGGNYCFWLSSNFFKRNSNSVILADSSDFMINRIIPASNCNAASNCGRCVWHGANNSTILTECFLKIVNIFAGCNRDKCGFPREAFIIGDYFIHHLGFDSKNNKIGENSKKSEKQPQKKEMGKKPEYRRKHTVSPNVRHFFLTPRMRRKRQYRQVG